MKNYVLLGSAIVADNPFEPTKSCGKEGFALCRPLHVDFV